MSVTPKQSTQQVIAKGSKSFYLASLFFPTQVKEDCWILYRWCRYCDDAVDLAANDDDAEVACRKLRELTGKALSGEATGEPVFDSLAMIFDKYDIPHGYAFDLIRGFEMDIEKFQYKKIQDLELYSYHVAGVVGVMMSYIMGISCSSALKHAIDVGTAMQLTNISRDVAEDFQKGRVYLPESWLADREISKERLLSEPKEDLYKVVEQLLDHADRFYLSGLSGIRFLSFRTALAVSIAAAVYSEIGHKLRRLGPSALESRVYIPFSRKLICVLRGSIRVLPLAFIRMLKPWAPVSIESLGG